MKKSLVASIILLMLVSPLSFWLGYYVGGENGKIEGASEYKAIHGSVSLMIGSEIDSVKTVDDVRVTYWHNGRVSWRCEEHWEGEMPDAQAIP